MPPVDGYDASAGAVVVRTGAGRLKLQAVTPGIIRVVYTERERFGTSASLMVLPGLPASAPAVRETATGLELCTARIRLLIDARHAAFTWTDAAGGLLLREPHDGAPTRVLDEVEVLAPLHRDGASASMVHGADGMKAVAGDAARSVDRLAYATTSRLRFADDEAVYGLGQHEEGVLNYRNRTQYLYQHNLKAPAPMLVSTRGYALLWDTQSAAVFRDEPGGATFRTDIDDELEYYFILGPELDQIVAAMRTLTGRVPMLPRWALGYFQSKERYTSARELLDVAGELRRRRIPVDCIVQDWLNWPGDLWGQKSFDPARYPDPGGLCAALHALDTHLMVSIWPNLHNDGPDQVELRRHGLLLADGSTYDALQPRARELYWHQVNRGYFRFGVDAWWADCSEPFEADWHGTDRPDPPQRATLNTDAAKRYLDGEHLNAYPLQHVRGLYEGQRRTAPDKRVVVLTRASYPGQQRYGAITWSGDTSASWDTLRRQIADGLNFCLTGNPRWSSDIGGFFTDTKEPWFWRGEFPAGCADPGYRELYVRWLQFATFLPNFRAHGTDTPREPWHFGEPGEPVYDTIVAFIRLRYRLLPYLYTLHGWETQRHYTSMRALAFDFRHDPGCHDVDNQFMLGPALLVCPVTEPTPSTNPTREVYLPHGCDWYDFWTAQRHPGGQRIHAPAHLHQLPLFVRAGAILPVGPDRQHADEHRHAPLHLRLHPGADGAFDLYDDAGDGYGYEHGEHAVTPLRWNDATRELAIRARAGSYPGMPDRQRFIPALPGSSGGPAVDYHGRPVTIAIP